MQPQEPQVPDQSNPQAPTMGQPMSNSTMPTEPSISTTSPTMPSDTMSTQPSANQSYNSNPIVENPVADFTATPAAASMTMAPAKKKSRTLLWVLIAILLVVAVGAALTYFVFLKPTA